ncbi:MAG: hypothetical protein KC591_01955 [Gemmatimonadetes bacterium]|nr:hypothetical protein [Gemmatimonadota bacterium]
MRPLLLVLSAPGLLAADGREDPAADEPWDVTATSSFVERGADGANVLGFVDDVVIVHGDLVATGDRATYFGGTRRALLQGNVRMEQDSTIARGPAAYYERDQGLARFPNGIYLERPSGTLVADDAFWWRREDRFELTGRVSAADTTGTLDAESVTWDAAQDRFWAVGNARLVDDESGAIVRGESMRYDRARGLATATGSPSADFLDEGGVDVRITAETLTWDPVARSAVAREDVRIVRGTMEGTSGVLQYWRNDERVVLTESPTLVDGATTISGDRIELDSRPGGRRVIRVKGHASVANRLVSTRERPAPPDAGPLLETLETARVKQQGRADSLLASLADSSATGDSAAAPLGPVPGPLPEIAAPPDSATAREAVETALAASASPSPPTAPAAGDAPAPADSAATEDDRPEWLRVPSEQLPRENLLFGDQIDILVVDDVIVSVDVIGSGRSKFFPSEETGDLSEWNDVRGDTLHVWFSDSEVDSVLVLGAADGEYRLPAGTDEGAPRAELKRLGKLVEYKAPRIRYQRAAETMYLEDGAEVHYQDMVLTSGDVEFDANRGVMTASGDPGPVLKDAGGEIRGTDMNYHLDAGQGEIVGGRTKFEDAWYRGEDIWKLSEDELAIRNGWFTTCDLEHPHYEFASRQMKVYLGDKVVAKPVVFYVRHIPILAVPYYMASLKKGRQSGFLLPNLELGVDDSRGRFIRNMGYYWAPNDYYDAKLTFDFYPQQDRLVTRLENRYALRYRYSGSVNLMYNRDAPNNRRETSLRFNHKQQLGENTDLTGDGTFVSAADIFKNTDDVDRLQRDLSSRITLSHRFRESNQSLIAQVTQNRNLDTGFIRETLPQVDYTLPSRPIRKKSEDDDDTFFVRSLANVYYGLSAQALHERQESVVNDVKQEERHVGSEVNGSLRTTFPLKDWIRLTPSATGDAAWIDEDRLGERNPFRATYRTSVAATSDIYGMFLRPIGPLKGVRHVITPSASWNWAPEFSEYFYTDSLGVERDRFFSFGSIGGTPRKTNSLNFAMRNLIQTKFDRHGQPRRYDLFTLQNSIAYDLLARDRGQQSLSNLSSSLVVLSSLPVNQTWTVAHDPYSWGLRSTAVTTRVGISTGLLRRAASAGRSTAGGAVGPSGGGPDGAGADSSAAKDDAGGGGAFAALAKLASSIGDWSLDASHTYRKTRGAEPSTSLDIRTRWDPSELWSISFDTQYDLRTGDNTGQRWSVHRKIHCWELSFDRRLLGREWQYYFRINITDLPDLKAERAHGLTGSTSSLGSGGFLPLN